MTCFCGLCRACFLQYTREGSEGGCFCRTNSQMKKLRLREVGDPLLLIIHFVVCRMKLLLFSVTECSLRKGVRLKQQLRQNALKSRNHVEPRVPVRGFPVLLDSLLLLSSDLMERLKWVNVRELWRRKWLIYYEILSTAPGIRWALSKW